MGPASRVPTCRRGRPWKRSASLRPTDLLGADAATSAASTTRQGFSAERSTLDFGPPLDPLVVVLADVTPVVAAVRQRRRPVVEVVQVLLARCVVLVAVALVLGERARLRVGRRLTEPLGDLGVDLRIDDVV